MGTFGTRLHLAEFEATARERPTDEGDKKAKTSARTQSTPALWQRDLTGRKSSLNGVSQAVDAAGIPESCAFALMPRWDPSPTRYSPQPRHIQAPIANLKLPA